MILFGEASEKIDKEIGFSPTIKVSTLDEAFKIAVQSAVQGDVILLSPGCTSFDQYKSYEERGEHFRKLVLNYEKS